MNQFKNLLENLIDTYILSYFYTHIIASECVWFILLTQTQEVTVIWTCIFLGHFLSLF